VDPANIFPYLTGPAGALAVLIWVVWMQRRDIAELRKIIDAERRRADSAEEAARTTYELLAGLVKTGRDRT
jgi:hypothetical protein